MDMTNSDSGPTEQGQESRHRRYRELRLLHIFIVAICPQLPGTHQLALEALWTKDVPEMSLTSEPLLNAIFALSCLYLTVEGKSADASLTMHRANYLGAAIQTQQANLAYMSHENADATCMASVLLAIDAFASLMSRSLTPYMPPLEWFRMLRGLGGVFEEATVILRNDVNAKMRPLVENNASFVNRQRVFSKHNCQELEHLDSFVESEVLDEEDAKACRNIASYISSVVRAREDGEHPKMICRRLTSFCVLAPARFVELLQQSRPHALVLLAHYFGLVSWVDYFWWVGPSPGREIQAIRSHLGPDWQGVMSWPMHQLTRQPYRELQ